MKERKKKNETRSAISGKKLKLKVKKSSKDKEVGGGSPFMRRTNMPPCYHARAHILSRANTRTITREHTYYHARTRILSRANTQTVTHALEDTARPTPTRTTSIN